MTRKLAAQRRPRQKKTDLLKHPFLPGQIVVCVDNSPRIPQSTSDPLKLCGLYRVATSLFSLKRQPGVTLVGLDPAPYLGWDAAGFKPVEAADPSFIKLIEKSAASAFAHPLDSILQSRAEVASERQATKQNI